MANHLPQRIVCLQPSATTILAAIGELDRVVACTKYCVDVCPDVARGNRIVVADSWTAKSAEILAAKPDLVIAAVPYQEKAVTEILKSGARFLGLAPKTLSDIYTDVAVLSGMVGQSDKGGAVIAAMQAEIEKFKHLCDGSVLQRVFCEEWGKPLIASQRWVAELIEAAGGSLVCEPGVQVESGEIEARDPDVLIASWCGAGDRVPLEKIIRDRGWESLSAVKRGRVYCISDELLNTPSPTLVQGLRAVAAALHPDRFPQPPGLRCIADQPVTRSS